jgi:hypothetical protein
MSQRGRGYIITQKAKPEATVTPPKVVEHALSPNSIVTSDPDAQVLNKKLTVGNKLKKAGKAGSVKQNIAPKTNTVIKTVIKPEDPLNPINPTVNPAAKPQGPKTPSQSANTTTRDAQNRSLKAPFLRSQAIISPTTIIAASAEADSAQVLDKYLGNDAHRKQDKVAKIEAQKTTLANENFYRIHESNNKEAEQKKRDNEEFIEAINLIEILNDTRLFLYFAKVIAKIVEAVRKEELQFAEQRTERIALINSAVLKYPAHLPLPDKKQSEVKYDVKYKEQIVVTAKAILKEIEVKKEVIETRMKNPDNWGATTWDAGLEIQAEKLHTKLAAKKENFANVIMHNDPERKLTEQQEVIVYDAFDDVNDELKKHVLEMPIPTPAIEHDKKNDIVFGKDAPDISNLPLPVFNYTFPAKGVYKSQLGKNIELGAIHAAINGYGKIKNKDKNIIESKEEKASGEKTDAKFDANTNIRLAVRYAASVTDELEAVAKNAAQFAQDSAALTNLSKLEKATTANLHALETKTELKFTAPRPSNP